MKLGRASLIITRAAYLINVNFKFMANYGECKPVTQ